MIDQAKRCSKVEKLKFRNLKSKSKIKIKRQNNTKENMKHGEEIFINRH